MSDRRARITRRETPALIQRPSEATGDSMASQAVVVLFDGEAGAF